MSGDSDDFLPGRDATSRAAKPDGLTLEQVRHIQVLLDCEGDGWTTEPQISPDGGLSVVASFRGLSTAFVLWRDPLGFQLGAMDGDVFREIGTGETVGRLVVLLRTQQPHDGGA